MERRPEEEACSSPEWEPLFHLPVFYQSFRNLKVNSLGPLSKQPLVTVTGRLRGTWDRGWTPASCISPHTLPHGIIWPDVFQQHTKGWWGGGGGSCVSCLSLSRRGKHWMVVVTVPCRPRKCAPTWHVGPAVRKVQAWVWREVETASAPRMSEG